MNRLTMSPVLYEPQLMSSIKQTSWSRHESKNCGGFEFTPCSCLPPVNTSKLIYVLKMKKRSQVELLRNKFSYFPNEP